MDSSEDLAEDVETGAVAPRRNKSKATEVSEGPRALVRNETRAVNILRIVLIVILLAAVIGSATATYKIFSNNATDMFESDFEEVADRITDAFLEGINAKLWSAHMMVLALSNVSRRKTNGTAAIFSVENFQDFSHSTRALARAWDVILSPILRTEDERAMWEAAQQNSTGEVDVGGCYICGSQDRESGAPDVEVHIPGYGPTTCAKMAEAVRDLSTLKPSECALIQQLADQLCDCGPSNSKTETWPDNRTDSDGMFRLENGAIIDEDGPGPYSPIQQIAPSMGREQAVMYNQMSHPIRSQALQSMVASKLPVISEMIIDRSDDFNRLIAFPVDEPGAVLFYPFYDEENEVIGSVGLDFTWNSLFDVHYAYPAHSEGVVVVLENTCGEVMSFEIGQAKLRSLGRGDHHDMKYDRFIHLSSYERFETYRRVASPLWQAGEEISDCAYRVRVYPSSTVESYYQSNKPVLYTLFVTLIFAFTIGIFIVYDCFVSRRQNKVLGAAERTDAIVSSLYPKAVRDRLFGGNDATGPSGRRRKKFRPRLETPKTKLRSFLATSPLPIEDDPDSEPIADLFSQTTVLFADIAGFTAWSSEREPYQVFQLLETLYNSFDKIARSLSVFKVETIGDCYMAVCGLPEPREDHAVAMAEFAHLCILEMENLTRRLEASLGPGTSELSLRVGLHSGPVTAGVLRGAKSRFQLFGDTVNTASRMESTGVVKMIHVSAETANLLAEAGKVDWVTERDELVAVKGKGNLQTYFVMPHGNAYDPNLSVRSIMSTYSSWRTSAGSRMSTYSEEPTEGRMWGTASLEESLAVSPHEMDKRSRMVEWNVDVLMPFLKKVVVKRQADSRPTRRRSLTHADGAVAVLHHESLPEPVEVGAEVRSQLRDYVAKIADLYYNVPFHNFEHASHVTMSANKLMKRIIRPDDVQYKTKSKRPKKQHKSLAQEIHKSTFGISSDPLMQLAVVFSALVHDVKHPGITNAQLVKENNPVALNYDGKSVLENQSIQCALDMLLDDDSYKDLQACIYASEEEKNRFRELVVTAIISTDIADTGLNNARKQRWYKVFHKPDANNEDKDDDDSEEIIERKATIVFEHIIQASDVAHTMQHWHIFAKWNERLFEERYSAFLAGRAEDPSIHWYEAELAFFDLYVIPLAKKLKECGVFGVSSDEYLNYAVENRREWEVKGQEITKKMLLRHSRKKDLMRSISQNAQTLRRLSLTSTGSGGSRSSMQGQDQGQSLRSLMKTRRTQSLRRLNVNGMQSDRSLNSYQFKRGQSLRNLNVNRMPEINMSLSPMPGQSSRLSLSDHQGRSLRSLSPLPSRSLRLNNPLRVDSNISLNSGTHGQSPRSLDPVQQEGSLVRSLGSEGANKRSLDSDQAKMDRRLSCVLEQEFNRSSGTEVSILCPLPTQNLRLNNPSRVDSNISLNSGIQGQSLRCLDPDEKEESLRSFYSEQDSSTRSLDSEQAKSARRLNTAREQQPSLRRVNEDTSLSPMPDRDLRLNNPSRVDSNLSLKSGPSLRSLGPMQQEESLRSLNSEPRNSRSLDSEQAQSIKRRLSLNSSQA